MIEGLCHCGCGKNTKIAKRSHKSQGIIKGKPNHYLKGHQPKKIYRGAENARWVGGRFIDKISGYVLIRCPDHPKAHPNHYIYEHILIAEKALGRFMPPDAQVHHINEIKSDNGRGNHVICQNDAYHKLLHQRTRAFYACGHASWKKCKYCLKYNPPENLIEMINGGRHSYYHRECKRNYDRNAYHNKRIREVIFL